MSKPAAFVTFTPEFTPFVSSHLKFLRLAKRIDWSKWAFDESIRRTILTSYMIQGFYSFLKEGMDPGCGRV